MSKITNIMVATDFGGETGHEVRYAFSLAEQLGARVFICAALEKESHTSHAYIDMAPAPTHEKLAEMRRAAIEKLRALAPAEFAGKVEFEAVAIVDQDPIEGVLDAVKEYEIDLLVLTSHGMGGIKSLLHGNASQRLVEHAPCPCLVLGPAMLKEWKED